MESTANCPESSVKCLESSANCPEFPDSCAASAPPECWVPVVGWKL